AAAPLRRYRAVVFSDERQERALPRRLLVLFAIESLGSRNPAIQHSQPREAVGRRTDRRRTAVEDLLHRDFGPRTQRARDGRRHDDRAGDQTAIWAEYLRLPRPAYPGTSPAAEGLRR